VFRKLRPTGWKDKTHVCLFSVCLLLIPFPLTSDPKPDHLSLWDEFMNPGTEKWLCLSSYCSV
jgi:hypothetical protein